MPRRKRQRNCLRGEYEIAGRFPTEELPWEECDGCLILRYKGDNFLCGQVSPKEGRFVHPLTALPKQVKLSDRVVVDGRPIPAGTVLTVLEPAINSEGYWCKVPHKGRHPPPPVLISQDKIEDKS